MFASRILRFFFILSLLFFGGIAINTQTIFIREFLVIFYGNELTIGVIFFIWFIGIVIGAWLSGNYIHKLGEGLLIGLYSFLLAIMSLVSVVSVFMIRISRGIFYVNIGEHVSFEKMILIIFITVVPFSFLVGFIFPLAANSWMKLSQIISKKDKDVNDDAEKIGRIYLYESLGSMIAGCLLAYLLYLSISNDKIVILVGILNSIITFLVYLVSCVGKRVFEVKFIIVAIICLILMLAYLSSKYSELSNYAIKLRWQSIVGDAELIKSVDTKYQNIALGMKDSLYMIYSNGKYLVSLPDEYSGAITAHIIMNQNPRIKEVLIIGFGAENVIKEMLEYDIDRLDYVVFEKEYIRYIKDYLFSEYKQLFKDKRLNIITNDGRYYINTTKNKYGLVVINEADPSNANINRYYTVDFYHKVRRCMKADGILIAFASSSINYFSEEGYEYTNSVYHTLKKVFKEVFITPGERAIFIATDAEGVATLDGDLLGKRYQQKNINSKYFTKYHFKYLLEPNRVMFIKKVMDGSKLLNLNTDSKPSTFFLNLVLWEKYSSPRFSYLLKSVRGIKFSFLILLLVIYFILRVVFGYLVRDSRRLKRYDVLVMIFIIGFIGISMDLLVLLMLQSLYGYIYRLVSLFIALFMGGITIGSYIGNKFLLCFKRLRKIMSVIIFLHLFIIFIAFLGKEIMSIGNLWFLQMILGSIMVISGGITGIFFPLANRLYIEYGGYSVISAGKTDSMDHLGAAIGSICTGCIFYPLIGLTNTFYFIACIAGISLLIFLLSFFNK